MTEPIEPTFSSLDEAPAAKAPQTDVKLLAVRYADSEAGIDGVRDKHEFEYSVRDCLHTGNCPCAVREFQLETEYIQFADGSVYCESLAGPYTDIAEMEQAMQVDDENARHYFMGHDW